MGHGHLSWRRQDYLTLLVEIMTSGSDAYNHDLRVWTLVFTSWKTLVFCIVGVFCLHLCCFLNGTPYRSLLQLRPYPYVLILMCLVCRRRALSSPQSVRWKKEERWHDCRNVLLPFFLHLPQHPDRLLSLNPYAFLFTTKIVLDGDLKWFPNH